MKEDENLDSSEVINEAESSEASESLDSSEVNDSQENQAESSLKLALKEMEEKYVRIHADFENTKKRLEKDKNLALEYAYEKIAKDLLPILDTLDSAKSVAEQHPAIKEGISLTRENLLKVLQKHGIEEIDTSGEFDPNIHECIMQVAKEGAESGQIAQVMQQGYKYKERTLRPAMVAIVKND